MVVAAALFQGVVSAQAAADEPSAGNAGAALCQYVADLENAKQLGTITVPFGEIDIDNDGVAEVVSEVVSGSAGAHSIQIVDGGCAETAIAAGSMSGSDW